MKNKKIISIVILSVIGTGLIGLDFYKMNKKGLPYDPITESSAVKMIAPPVESSGITTVAQRETYAKRKKYREKNKY